MKSRNLTSILASIGVSASLLIGVATPAKAASTWSGQGQSTLSTINATQPFIWWSHLYGSELLYIVKTTGNIFELRSMSSITSTSTTIMQVPPPYVNGSYDNHTFSWVENAGTFYFVGGNSTYGVAVFKYSGGGTVSLAVDVDKSSTAISFGANSTGSLIKWRNELWFTDSNGSATATNGLYHWDWTSSTAKLATVTAMNIGAAATEIQTPTLFNDKIYYRIGTGNVTVGSAAGVELYSYDGVKVELAANMYPETFSGSSANSGTPIAQSANSGLLPTGSASGCNFDGNNDHFVTTSQYMAYYAKSDSSGKFELWVMDTAGNVTNLHGKDPGSLANPNPDCLVNFNDTLYFTGSFDTSVGYELYKVTGGSTPTTTLVSDITAGSGSTFISSIRSTGSKMYYYVNGVGVYSFDGTNAAVKVADVPSSGAYNMQGFMPFDGKIWAATTVSSTTVFGSTPIDGATQAPVLAAQPDVTVPTGNITINPPAITTGPVSLWQISNLPAGLRYDPYTGIITGTVNSPVDLTVGINQVSYVAINSNFYTSTPTKMKLLITNSQPSFPASQSINTFVSSTEQFAPPINSGGAATSWSVNPALPAGLSMSSTTGYISGTAPATASSGAYTVTVSNSAGSTIYTLNLAVKVYAPAYTYIATYTNTCNYGVTCTNPALPTPITYFNSSTTASSASFSYAVSGLPDGLAINSSTGAISGTSTATGTYLLSMVVSNSSGSTTLPLKLTVGGPAPAFTVADVTAPQSSAYTSWVVPTPSSGTIATWSATGLPTGLTINASTGAITGTPTIAGTFNVALTGNNYGTSGNSTTVNFVFTITPVAPVVTAGQTKACEASVSGTTACSYTLTTSAGTATSWSITPALPSGLSLNTSTGVISGAALDNTQQVSTAYTVTATNAVGSGSATFMLAINDYAIVFTNNSPSSVTVTAFTPMTPWRPITVTSGHINTCRAFGGSLPTGLVINDSTCEISGTPTGASSSTILAITALGRTYQTSTTITVNVTNVAPTMDPIPDASQANTTSFSYQVTGKWINSVNSFACSISANKPAWLSITTPNCALTGTVPLIANSIGTKVVYSNITVTASNTYGSSSQTFTITALPTKPVITSAGSYTWAKDSAITAVNHPTLSYNNALSWSISPALPAGLSLDTTTGTITGTPTATMPSTTYTWTATNEGGSATITTTFAVTVQKPAFGTTVYSGAQSLTVDQPMTTINAPAYTNAGSPPTSWAISPALPTGLTFDTTTGSLSGTPTAAKLSTTYTVTSTNSAGTTSFTTFTIVATAVKPTFSAVSTQNLGRGVAYSLTLPNTGSKATSCTKSSGTLPTGISLSLVNGQCVLSGTPTTITSSSSVSFTASNAAGTSTALTFNIAVIDVPPVLSSVGVQSLTQGVPYTLAAPTNTGGTVTSWSISSGALPAGVTLQSDGSISGTPTTAGSWSATLQATNSGGLGTTQLSGTVAAVYAPSLTNPGTHLVTMGQSETFTIANSGSAATFSLKSGSSSLPTGFNLNTSTGEITGSSSTEQSARDVTIVATNYSGTAEVTFSIGVVQPLAILATVSPIQLVQGVAYTGSNKIPAPTNTGGVITSWYASNLPTGLTIGSDGSISGTPTGYQDATDATIRATTTGGDTSILVSFQVSRVYSPVLTNPGGQVVTMGNSLTITTSNSGSNATWTATGLPSTMSINSSTGVITGTPTDERASSNVTVTATNYSGTDSVTFTLAVNQPAPVLDPVTPQTLGQGDPAQMNAPNNTGGGNITWTATGLPAGLSINSTTGVVSGSPTTVQSATDATITATNSGGSSSITVSFEVTPQEAPVLTGISDQSFVIGQSYNISFTTSGHSGTWAATGLPAGLSLNTSTGVITGSPTTEQDLAQVTITVTNLAGSDTTGFFADVVQPLPILSDVSDQTITLGIPFTLNPPLNTGGPISEWSTNYHGRQIQGMGSGGGGGSYGPTGLPDGLSIDPTTGVISGTPTSLETSFTVTISAINSGGYVQKTFHITVNAPAPVLGALNDVTLTKGMPITTIQAPSNSGGDVVTWSSSDLPTGLMINSSTGAITGSPTNLQTVAAVSHVKAENSGGSDTVTISITVNDLVPQLQSPSTITLTKGVAISSPISVSNIGGDVVTWSSSDLPAGLSIDSTTGEITGTPTQLQALSVDAHVTAVNSGGSSTTTVPIVVNDQAPILASLDYQILTQGEFFSLAAIANTGGPIVTWSATGLPDGLTIDGNGDISGTPSRYGNFFVTIMAENSGGVSVATTFFSVIEIIPPSLTQISDQTFTLGQNYTLSFTNGGDPATWDVTGLPSGLTFNSATGDISGRASVEQASSPVTVTATNYTGTSSITFNLAVVQVAPSLSSVPAQTLTLGQSYSRSAPANSGGLVASWTSTDLPAGLSIDATTGAISGTPTALQTATDSHITATNSGGTQAITISFTVNEVIPDLGTYADMVLVLGNSITPISPTTNAGGEISRWTSSDLPSGLAIDSLTGVISGTPDTLQAALLAHITAENSGGTDTATISFAVNAVAPDLGALSNQTFTKGIAIAGVPAPSNAGGPVVTWSSTDLPNGLSINPSTGEITGTPTDLQTATTSTITATNTGGSGTTTIVISVVDVAPALTAHAAITITKGIAMTPVIAASNTGGAVVTWSSRNIPDGLSLDPTTGEISGTPTTIRTADMYVAGTNTGGEDVVAVSISVVDLPPVLDSMAAVDLTKGQVIAAISHPQVSSFGGDVVTWSASGLPNGLVIDASTGEITGTPTDLQTATNATVTATNTGGDGTTTILFTVNDVIPDLGALNSITLTKGQPMSPISAPSNAGGPVVTWSSDDLPNGLSIDPSTGVISGTPVELQDVTTTRVSATNTGGSDTTTISITVVDVAPSLTAHAAIRITKGVAMTPIVAATNSGGPIVTWSSGNIPDGLSLDPTTGEISGTPTTIRTADMYVTGTNTGGQDIVAVNIAVVDVAPAITGSYGLNSTQFTVTTPFNPIEAPAHTGQNLTWSARGLPTGVSIDSQTGAISGTPDTITNPTNAEITVSNSGGSASTTLFFQVNDFRPQLAPYTQDYSVTLGDSVTIPAPSNGGGAATSWSLAPGEVLPEGLSIDLTTGVISGTATRMKAAQPYIVQAHNSGGSHGSSVRIAVVDRLPAFGVVQSQTFTRYSAITPIDLASLNIGGDVLDWSSSGLPNGVTIDRTTGVISGTPSDSQTSTTATIFAENSGGITTIAIDIVVNDVPPLVTADLGSRTITQYEPFYRDLVETAVLMNSGHITQWTATGLPDGLAIDASTGVISGITTSDQATTATITASNSQGSVQSTLSFVIVPVVAPIMAQNIPAQAYTIGQSYTLTISNSSSPAHNWSNIGLPSFCGLYGANNGLSAVVECSPVAEMPAQTVVVTGTNRAGSDSTTFTIAAVQPLPNLVHSPASSMRLNRPVSEFPLVNTGGPIASWDAANLPPGVTINHSTGVLTGSPTSLGRYDVVYTATNSGGSVTETQVFIVIDNEIMLSPISDQTFTLGRAITPIDASQNATGGAIVGWEARGLPTGLSIDSQTGVISGTPTQLWNGQNAVVSAHNSGCDGTSCGTVMFTITVNDVAPTLGSFANQVFTVGTDITPIQIQASGGGPVVTWSIPNLPRGLTFNSDTLQITGRPDAVSGSADYDIIATNTGGYATAHINITVNDVLPDVMDYSPQVLTKGQQIVTPIAHPYVTLLGGAVVSWSSTDLPNGLQINSVSGAITGTPTTLQSATTAHVLATNSGGSTTVPLLITVNDAAPSLGTLPAQLLTIGTPVSIAPPTNSGGAVVTWSSTNLPHGLAIDASTGLITGTPDIAQVASNSTIRASNTGGNADAVISFTVSNAPILAAVNDVVINSRNAYSLSISNSGGAITSWSISAGALPNGLSINSTSGLISGSVTRDGSYTATIRASNYSGAHTTTVNFLVDTAAPVIQSSRVNSHGDGLVVIFSEPMGSTLGPVSGFTVKVENVTNVVTGVAVSSTGLTIDLTNVITAGQRVTLSFTNSSLQDAQGVAALAVNNVAVTNFLVTLAYPVAQLTCSQYSGVAPQDVSSTNCAQMNTAFSTLNPTAVGFVSAPTYSVVPALPAGLSLNETTGVISGTPTGRVSRSNYRVTATRNSQVATFDVHLKVIYTPTRPSTGSTGVSINNAATWTNTTSVTLNIVWPQGASFVQVSNDGGMTVSTNFDVAPTIPWTLDSSQSSSAQRSVYVRFLDTDRVDLAQNSSAFSDDIELDYTVPAVATLTAAANAAGVVTVNYSVTDNTGGSGVASVQVSDAQDSAAASSTPLTGVGTAAASGSVTLQDSMGTTVFMRVRDFAGNYSGWSSQMITMPPPPPLSKTGDNVDGGEVIDTGTITGPSGSSNFTDGSGLDVSAAGVITPRIKSSFIGSISGTVTVTYFDVTSHVRSTWVCTVAKYGNTKKNPKLKLNPKTKKFPAVTYKPKVGCAMPAPVLAARDVSLIGVVTRLTFARLYPTTGLAVNPVNKKKIKPVVRIMRLSLGVRPS